MVCQCHVPTLIWLLNTYFTHTYISLPLIAFIVCVSSCTTWWGSIIHEHGHASKPNPDVYACCARWESNEDDSTPSGWDGDKSHEQQCMES